MRTLLASIVGIALALSTVTAAVAADRDASGKTDGTVSDKVKKKVTGESVDREQDPVKAAQKALKAKGYEIGDVDGKLGPKTRAGVQAFQKDEGLRVTGRLDGETMARLRAGKADDRGTGDRASRGNDPVSASPETERARTRRGGDALGNSPQGEMAKDVDAIKEQEKRK